MKVRAQRLPEKEIEAFFECIDRLRDEALKRERIAHALANQAQIAVYRARRDHFDQLATQLAGPYEYA